MPAGRTHDQITLVSLPLVVVLALLFSHSALLTLICSGGFLFSGLMFGPDLDIPSCQYRRWGWLRWIWLPYQRSLPHRSVWSHGFLIGTLLRVIYLSCWLFLFATLFYTGLKFLGYRLQDWQDYWAGLQNWLNSRPKEVLALWAGLELGSMSHSWSDWLGSAWKRWRRRASSQTRHRQVANRTLKAVKESRLSVQLPSISRSGAASGLWRAFSPVERDQSIRFCRGIRFSPPVMAQSSADAPNLKELHLQESELREQQFSKLRQVRLNNPSELRSSNQPGVQFPVQDLGRFHPDPSDP
jgi:uncharacterized metal-binding protein